MNYLTDSWDDSEFPLAYLITIRTYGTWLHGDMRISVDRHHGRNQFGSPKIKPSKKLETAMKKNADQKPFVMSKRQRVAVDLSIRESCKVQSFHLLALNVRTNHLHAVVSAKKRPEFIIAYFKRYATRKLRDSLLVLKDEKIWSRGGSRTYLWGMRNLERAIDYVLYGQGKLDFE